MVNVVNYLYWGKEKEAVVILILLIDVRLRQLSMHIIIKPFMCRRYTSLNKVFCTSDYITEIKKIMVDSYWWILTTKYIKVSIPVTLAVHVGSGW